MSYNFYKILHFISLFSLFLSYGLIISPANHFRKWSSSLHGISCLILFISGFGLIAKLNISLQFSDQFIVPILHSMIWFIPIIVYFVLFKKIKLAISPRYEIFQKIFLLIFFYMSIFELSKIITPEWIGAKFTSWLAFAFSVPFLAYRKKTHPAHLILISFLLIILGYFTIRFAIYKN